MAELKIRAGDYISHGSSLRRVDGSEGLLQRVMFKLTARRGKFPFQELGSRLWQLSHVPAAQRQMVAKQYVAEALADEELEVEAVTLEPRGDGTMNLTAELRCQGETLTVAVNIQ